MNRRARIKGIANIPVRRKNDASNDIKQEPPVSPEKQNTEEKPEINQDVLVTELQENPLINNINNINKTELPSENHISTQIAASNNPSNKLESITEECQNIASENNITSVIESDNINIKTEANNTITNQTVSRRWIPKPKPMVKNPTMLRRPKPVLLPLKEKTESVINQNIENENPTNRPEEELKSPPPVQNSVTPKLEPIHCPLPNDSILKSPTDPERMSSCPLSPNKILNRARIRPTPKLIRRNSVQGSASESEDDGRRSRIRNDSVCSTTSYTTEIVTVKESTTISKDKLISIRVQKLFRRSEQSRKVAEARKDFYQKFGTNIPDKKRLTMMDLIYYNPTSNPMAPRKQNTSTEEVTPVEPAKEEEENEDNPEEADEEDSNPVPQVKVGPNGEIILDEQSLVIEQTGTKKGREKLANSQVVNVDDLDRSYGIYKRPKRSKDWSALETLRFYRSLNTVGTDFSLMVGLFPGRTRRELKMKFKKEERINRQLIDKALTNPVDFDLSALESQLKEEEEFIKKINEEDKLKKHKVRKPRKYNISFLASQMDEENEDNLLQQKVPKIRPKRMPKGKKDRYSALNISEITTSSEESDNECPNKKVRTNSCKPLLRNRDNYTRNSKDNPNVLLNEQKRENITPKTEIKSSIEEQNNNEKVDKTNEHLEEINYENMEIINENIIENIIETSENIKIYVETLGNIEENMEETHENMEETHEITEEPHENTEETHETIKELIENTEENEDSLIKSEEKNENIDENEEESDETCEDEGESVKSEDNNIFLENDNNCAIPNILPNDLSTVEPGSLMILSIVGPDGQQIFKMFMVTPGQSKVPVNLSDDVMQSLTTSLGSAQAVTLDLPVINESDNQMILSDGV